MDSHGLADWLGYLSHEEIDFLKSLAQLLPRQPMVVNLGAGGGTSALAFLEARPDLLLCSIDIQEESSPLGCLEGERRAVEQSGLAWQGRLIQIWDDSREVGRNWQQGQVDMVFVDGDHSYDGCRGDIEAWLPNVRPSGILALHDYRQPGEEKTWPGVADAVDELLLPRFCQVGRTGSVIAFRIG